MIKFLSLGSGSSGNCYYLLDEDTQQAILIDAGIGIRRLKKLFKEYNIDHTTIKALLITHDHADHIKGAGYVTTEFGIPAYASSTVHHAMQLVQGSFKKLDRNCLIDIDPGERFEIGRFHIQAFSVPHDAADNVGYEIRVESGETKDESITFVLMTDVGSVTEDIQAEVGRANYLVMEANYDIEMLKNGPYPQYLKERIRSGTGHMSNNQAAKLLREYMGPDLKHVWLCHLSAENNHPELARKTIEMELRRYGIIAGTDFELDVLKRLVPSGPWLLK